MALVSKYDTNQHFKTFFFPLKRKKFPLQSTKSNPTNMWPGMCFWGQAMSNDAHV